MSDAAAPEAQARAPVRASKSASAFRTISEVADDLDVAQHVLRFWESKFPQVRPLKRGGGRRYYRPEDVELLRQIRTLLYQEGYTIKGAQKLLRQRGRRGEDDDEVDRPPAAAQRRPSPRAAAATAAVAPKQAGAAAAAAAPRAEGPSDPLRAGLRALRVELVAVRELLRGD